MPQDPRHGQHGHQSPYPGESDDGNGQGSSQGGRRRRALGDDGTGGTRVIDLLSKHGKAPGGANGSHRRAAEPEEPASGGRRARQEPAPQPPAGHGSGPRTAGHHSLEPETPGPQTSGPQTSGPQTPGPQTGGHAVGGGQPRNGPPSERRSDWTPPETGSRSGGHSRSAGPTPGEGRHSEPRGIQQPSGPPSQQTPLPPNAQPRHGHAPSAQPITGPQPPAAPPRPQDPQGRWTAESADARPSMPPGAPNPGAPARGQWPAREQPQRRPAPPPPPPGPPPNGAAPNGAGPNGAPANGAPANGMPPGAAPANGAPVNGAANGAPANGMPAGAAPPAAPPPTKITQALSGGAPAEAEPAAPPEPERPSGPRPMPGRPAPGRPPANRPAPSAPSADLEATAQHAPIPVDDRPAAPPNGAGMNGTGMNGADVEATAVAGADLDAFEEDLDDREDALDRTEVDNAEIRQIDATLARFSAVHDQIAEEEAERRNKFSWLLGKRGSEPELGKDMPFDFQQRDAGASRVDWKKSQRKRRTTRIISVVAVAAALIVFVVAGISFSAPAPAGPQQVAALAPGSPAIKNVSSQTGDLNVLLVGADGTAADGAAIAHIPADRSHVQVVSFPKDLRVDVAGCDSWDPATGRPTGRALPTQQVRLGEAYALGGPKCTTEAVQRLSGLAVTNFLGVDAQGVKSAVDAVRGVELCTRQVVDGDRALAHARAPQEQVQRQQELMSGLLRKASADPEQLVQVLAANSFGDNVDTARLTALVGALRGMDVSKVTFTAVPASADGTPGPDAAALFRGIIDDTPAPPQVTAPSGGCGR